MWSLNVPRSFLCTLFSTYCLHHYIFAILEYLPLKSHGRHFPKVFFKSWILIKKKLCLDKILNWLLSKIVIPLFYAILKRYFETLSMPHLIARYGYVLPGLILHNIVLFHFPVLYSTWCIAIEISSFKQKYMIQVSAKQWDN